MKCRKTAGWEGSCGSGAETCLLMGHVDSYSETTRLTSILVCTEIGENILAFVSLDRKSVV